MTERFETVLDVLERFKSIKNWGEVLLALPSLPPRYYTIASSSTLSPNELRLIISITREGEFFGHVSDLFYQMIKKEAEYQKVSLFF